jgi:hypothetical protein
MKTKDQIAAEIVELEIKLSKTTNQNDYLRVLRKIQKLRDML